jgi:hypothetical protein
MNKPVLAKSKATTIFLVFSLGYFISNLLRTIAATIAPELISEFNSFKLAMLFVFIISPFSYLFLFGNLKILSKIVFNFE